MFGKAHFLVFDDHCLEQRSYFIIILLIIINNIIHRITEIYETLQKHLEIETNFKSLKVLEEQQ